MNEYSTEWPEDWYGKYVLCGLVSTRCERMALLHDHKTRYDTREEAQAALDKILSEKELYLHPYYGVCQVRVKGGWPYHSGLL